MVCKAYIEVFSCFLFLKLKISHNKRLHNSLHKMFKAVAETWLTLGAKSLRSCLTLCGSMDFNQPGSSVHGISQAKKTGLGCYALLQGIFLTQRSNPRLLQLLDCRWILYRGATGKPKHSKNAG